ncbi:hypothetical protein [Paenibacillus methanolicus]|uniref:Uncharacterized protein n=1 Tax=Paenibacillus methanolicus TaxID=582686 RepID=A0A5S5CH39_9BACL|nr:hypothetical protein [Paenibacillus methanolicus]TYP79109.1 hypothetical protein BCM02_101225 [Paenibacillus methanolicus]
MKIQLVLFLASSSEIATSHLMLKTFTSDIRPVRGDLIDDPGFDPRFHNGYEVAKVTISYASEECWVSLAPLAIEAEEMPLADYKAKLAANGWREVTKVELQQGG